MNEPKSLQEALQGYAAKEWNEALKSEFESFSSLNGMDVDIFELEKNSIGQKHKSR